LMRAEAIQDVEALGLELGRIDGPGDGHGAVQYGQIR
jgi:hypothetical protein